jgi:hypothetical protein
MASFQPAAVSLVSRGGFRSGRRQSAPARNAPARLHLSRTRRMDLASFAPWPISRGLTIWSARLSGERSSRNRNPASVV